MRRVDACPWVGSQVKSSLESGRPEPVLGICSTPKTRDEARNPESGWSEPRSWKLVYSRIWAAPRPQLNGTVCPAPPGAFEPIPPHSFFFFASCGNSESWKVETAITLPVVCTFPAREMPLQRCKAIAGHFAPGARNGLARARVRRAPRAARHRLGARSHPRRTG